jgi:hypothetical protein
MLNNFLKLKEYFYKINFFFFFSGINLKANNWIKIEQELNKLKFNYNKINNNLALNLFLILGNKRLRLLIHVCLFLFVSFLQGGVPSPSLCADFNIESVVEPMDLDQIEVPRATNNNIPPNRVVIDDSNMSGDFSDITARNDSRTPRNSLISTAEQQNVSDITTESQPRRSERIASQTRGMVPEAYTVVDADSRLLDPRVDSRMGMLSSSDVASIPVSAINRQINVVDGVVDELRVTNMGRLREEFMENSTGNKKNPLSCLKSLFPRTK